MLKPPYPSSPNRLPIDHLYFRLTGRTDSLNTIGFSALYAERYFLNTILELHPNHKWLDSNTIEITNLDLTLTIKGAKLEDALEYTPTQEEAKWHPEEPDLTTLRRIANFHLTSRVDEEAPTTKAPAPPPTQSYRHKTQKPSRTDGNITVASIAASLNIQPNKARNILRKANIQKPPQGWEFSPDDPQIAIITKLLQSAR